MNRNSFTGRDAPLDRANRLNKWKADHETRISTLEARITAHLSDSTATDVATLKADFNALLQALRDVGLMKST